MPVILIGTLDTKGVEFQFVRDLLNAAGVATLVIDAGVQGPPHFAPDIPRDEVFNAANTSLATLQQAADRGRSLLELLKILSATVPDFVAVASKRL